MARPTINIPIQDSRTAGVNPFNINILVCLQPGIPTTKNVYTSIHRSGI